MDRSEFERLRDLPGKTISGDIVLQRNRETAPLLSATVYIDNSAGVEAKVKIELNEQTDSKTINVWVPGTGAICRLDIDAREHKPYGRNHKHSLKQPDCSHSSINLSRDIIKRDDLKGKSIQEVFTDFCQKSNIQHNGTLTIAT